MKNIKTFLLLIVVIHVLFMTGNSSYSQNGLNLSTHSITIQTKDGYAKVNILDKPKKKILPKEYLMYTWYLDDAIHNSAGGYSGKLLHGDYTEYYSSDNLKEQGNYINGLKHGYWKDWYSNGILNTVVCYRNGLKNGVTREYDQKGNLILLCYYKNGLKDGKYCTYVNGIIIDKKYYNKGEERIGKKNHLNGVGKEKDKNIDDKKVKKNSIFKRIWERIFKKTKS
jgi:antitoxin component YwqK of YwqJK toxin-antitoxin module